MISVLTVNYNAPEFIEILLTSIRNTCDHLPPVIIVDNSQFISKISSYWYNNLRIFNQKRNIGHGEGINVGLKEAKTEYVLILDSDRHFVESHWSELLLHEIEDVIVAKGSDA